MSTAWFLDNVSNRTCAVVVLTFPMLNILSVLNYFAEQTEGSAGRRGGASRDFPEREFGQTGSFKVR